MTDFSEFIEDMELVDLDLKEEKYTWKKGDSHNSAARFDRILISNEMDDSFRYIKQYVLHTPIMLQCGEWKASKSYFKFKNWWLQTEGFKERVKQWWDSFKYEGSSDYILMAKLKAVKVKLKEWSKTRQGNLGVQKHVLSQLEAIERIQEYRVLNE